MANAPIYEHDCKVHNVFVNCGNDTIYRHNAPILLQTEVGFSTCKEALMSLYNIFLHVGSELSYTPRTVVSDISVMSGWTEAQREVLHATLWDNGKWVLHGSLMSGLLITIETQGEHLLTDKLLIEENCAFYDFSSSAPKLGLVYPYIKVDLCMVSSVKPRPSTRKSYNEQHD